MSRPAGGRSRKVTAVLVVLLATNCLWTTIASVSTLAFLAATPLMVAFALVTYSVLVDPPGRRLPAGWRRRRTSNRR